MPSECEGLVPTSVYVRKCKRFSNKTSRPREAEHCVKTCVDSDLLGNMWIDPPLAEKVADSAVLQLAERKGAAHIKYPFLKGKPDQTC